MRFGDPFTHTLAGGVRNGTDSRLISTALPAWVLSTAGGSQTCYRRRLKEMPIRRAASLKSISSPLLRMYLPSA